MNEPEPITQSMGDFVTLLVREISQSLALARHEASLVRVDRVRVRFGQEEGADSVISERYPFLADGWEVEMDLGPTLQARLLGDPIEPVEPGRPLLELFGPGPVSDIKGVDRDWADFFAEHGIKTIAGLAELSPEDLTDLARERASIRLWEIQGKARLLGCESPFFPPSPLDDHNLYEILKMGSAEILKITSVKSVTREEVRRLLEILQLLTVSLDARVLKSLSLEKFLNG
ncbi:hypothetical protein [Desulfospira joergensenii]|uniref:hypothetical protein n=1 Tax=Desulfospira joergensenii TaxID=53329 RepID=UPI0003B523D3|nr:hypothetical protein [Desulfospira joergensenii]